MVYYPFYMKKLGYCINLISVPRTKGQEFFQGQVIKIGDFVSARGKKIGIL